MNPRLLFILVCLPLSSCQRDAAGEEEATIVDETPVATPDPTANQQFASVIEDINSKCPEEYPEIVTPLPEARNFDSIGNDELMKMLESWNPALRSQAARALSLRGPEVMDVLRQGTGSDNWMVRAGSATALASILQKELQSAKREEQEALKEKHGDIVAVFVRLATDERREVRGAALKGLEIVAPQTPEALRAMLTLINDSDDFIAQSAMITLSKRFGLDPLDIEEVIPQLKDALDGELPRGRGSIVTVVERLKPEIQRKFVPDLLAHLDWQPRRDTMFAAGGQDSAVKILAKLQEPQLIERLPRLMIKDRGPGFDVCLDAAKSYGKDAKVIGPELKAILDDIETNGKEAKIQPPQKTAEASLRKLRETIEYLESL